MKISLLAITLFAIFVVGLHAVRDNGLERKIREASEDAPVDEEPEQTDDDDADDEAEAAAQDEPVNDEDESDDDASSDAPEDQSDDDSANDPGKDEPANIDENEEPTVEAEEEGEGEEAAEVEAVEIESLDDADADAQVVVKRSVSRRCQGPAVAGKCKKKITRYHYNAEKKVCGSFLWSGCGATPNNWVSLKACRNTCVPKKPPPKPALPPPKPSPNVKRFDKIRCVGPDLRGPCKKNIKRYHYDAALNRCHAFQYSGCGGNENNFLFLVNCNKACVKKDVKPKPTPKPAMKWNDKRRCQGPQVSGPCKAAVRRYHYNAATNKCTAFTWGGCKATPNTWVYLKNCQKICVANKPSSQIKWDNPKRCLGPKLRGPCKKNIRRYHYNAATDKCEAFSFGGCKGNINNWVYIKNCQKICTKNKPTKPAKLPWNDKRRCVGAALRGPCKKKITRYHYNAEKDQCEPFQYSGCGGNNNNWWYKGNCQKICTTKHLRWNDPNRCKGPQVRGPCKKNIRRYHYDAAQDKCVPFSYGGCAGNDNNWWYIKNCQKICVKKTSPPAVKPVKWDDPIRCQGPVVVGNCKQSIRRYHYNAATDRCEEFQYSGCGGNNNNWWYLKNCQKICVKNSANNEPDDTDNETPETDPAANGGIIFTKDPAQCEASNGGVETKVPNPCPNLTCDKRCRFGFVSNAAGCPLCQCSASPCQTP
jgi:hypothetical protein